MSSTDHPRSRGVYSPAPMEGQERQGSSPLARGLLIHISEMTRRYRIIPARAGFTRLRRSSPSNPRDHPRSRGVYAKLFLNSLYGKGSSPLARGLRLVTSDYMIRWRIIPARAGFTHIEYCTGGDGGDHPRSRGVYIHMSTDSRPISGSSPLARGLHFHNLGFDGIFRIIPARAGFTGAHASHTDTTKDHPRSRGVYAVGLYVPGYCAGSSPLARGLQGLIGGENRFRGIIPARAGFTQCRRTGIYRSSDHPRSRGVYVTR